MSLAEMLVCCALVALLMTALYALLDAGIRYYRTQNATVEVQQQTLVGLAALTGEMAEGSRGAIQVDGTPPVQWIVFASPRDLSGHVSYDQTEIYWHKWVCFYLDEVNNVPCLVRKEEGFAGGPVTYPPPVPPDKNGDYFRNASLTPKVVARHIVKLESTQSFPIPVKLTGEVTNRYLFRVEVGTSVTMKN